MNAKRALSSISRRDRTALAETIASDLAERLSDAIGAEVAVDNPNDGDDLWVQVCRLMTRMVKPPTPAVCSNYDGTTPGSSHKCPDCPDVMPTDPGMTFEQARAIVTADIRQSYSEDEMSDAECIEHARNTLSIVDIDTDDELVSRAYILVLATDPAS